MRIYFLLLDSKSNYVLKLCCCSLSGTQWVAETLWTSAASQTQPPAPLPPPEATEPVFHQINISVGYQHTRIKNG